MRFGVAQALGQLGRTDDAVRLLLELAQNKETNQCVRLEAAKILEQLGRTNDAMRLLLKLARSKFNLWDRAEDIIKTLEEFGLKNPHVALTLYKLTKSSNYDIRNLAFDGLRQVVGNLRYEECKKAVSLRHKTEDTKPKAQG